ncbi:GMC family oxidoreductase N-terminal domain-containing protein [Pulveribacter sp.]|uniref:GMC family oxidoreductase n=1 Tax=Pulveribacter sp. TaxID=2678893 RepID=UPI00289EFAE6|nr:GMC family oxidoreductase N-terminal domain-containing protein [Pulveribacter sp.]
MQESFDYVVVGAGAAGAIVARRLAEANPTVSVCLLEAGPPDRHPYLHLPAGFIKMLFDPKYTWTYGSEPDARTLERRVPLPQGKTLGGSSAINGLIYNRGQAEDYDGWAALGNPGWSFAEVLPYFRRNERWLGPKNSMDSSTRRGTAGRVPVTPIDWPHPICEAFIAGAQEQGLPRNPDYNGDTQAGVGYFQRTIHRGWRQSTARGYLRSPPSNLAVRTHAQATRIVLQGTRATSVEYTRGGPQGNATTVGARREVIVCAGAINTPRLLQLSGIGPADHLQALGLPVVHSLAGVGAHLKDHFSVRVVGHVRRGSAVTINELARMPRLWGQAARWLAGQPNILALSPSLVHFFWHSGLGDGVRPDLQGVFTPASYREGYVGQLDTYPGMTCGVWAHRPRSEGEVRLRSSDPWADPLIRPNYLSHEEDVRVLTAGVRLARGLLRTQALAPFFAAEAMPGQDAQSDEDILAYIRRYGVSSYHLCGTARMGPADDPGAVVDAQLRVHGLQGLRVADSSVMPAIPSANICAASMMIGEKAADLILGRNPC